MVKHLYSLKLYNANVGMCVVHAIISWCLNKMIGCLEAAPGTLEKNIQMVHLAENFNSCHTKRFPFGHSIQYQLCLVNHPVFLKALILCLWLCYPLYVVG